MPLFTVEATGHVFRDRSPKRRQAYFPSVVETRPGELIVSFDMGTDMENADVRTYVCRSNDGGESWNEPACIYDPIDVDYPASTLGRLSRLADGTLVGLITACNRSRIGQGLANPATEGYVETRFGITESSDGGQTWTPLRWIDPPIDWNAFEACSPILEVAPDRWVLPTSTWRAWDGACPFGMKAIAFLSQDRGCTWLHCADVMDAWDQRVASWEQKQAVLPDGRLLAVCWAYSYDQQKSLRNRYTISAAGGYSFGPAREAPVDGETCTPLALNDNHVVCAYRRHGKKGLWLHAARIEGEQWTPIADELLWGGAQASYGMESSSKTEEMATLQFGYPQLTRLADGSIIVVFWCVENEIACVRWIRLRLEDL